MSKYVWHQRLSSAFDLLLIFLCSLIQTPTLTPTPNNALVAGKHGHVRVEGDLGTSYFLSIPSPFALLCLSKCSKTYRLVRH